jgi:predicted metal-binding membrane protein
MTKVFDVRRELMAVDIVATFMGLIIMSFIIERLLEIFSSIIDFVCCRKTITSANPIKKFFAPIDDTKSKELDTIKRLIFTPVGFLAAWKLISLLGVAQVGLLHTSTLVKGGAETSDLILTALAISWGTGPIHSFFDSLQKYGKSGQ